MCPCLKCEDNNKDEVNSPNIQSNNNSRNDDDDDDNKDALGMRPCQIYQKYLQISDICLREQSTRPLSLSIQ